MGKEKEEPRRVVLADPPAGAARSYPTAIIGKIKDEH
jgi:hypothetical protein